jgi:hypothetical protein
MYHCFFALSQRMPPIITNCLSVLDSRNATRYIPLLLCPISETATYHTQLPLCPTSRGCRTVHASRFCSTYKTAFGGLHIGISEASSRPKSGSNVTIEASSRPKLKEMKGGNIWTKYWTRRLPDRISVWWVEGKEANSPVKPRVDSILDASIARLVMDQRVVGVGKGSELTCQAWSRGSAAWSS